MTWAAMLFAAALLILPDRPRVRLQAATPVFRATPTHDDPLALASGLEVFAACLSAGMAIGSAAAAAAPAAPRPLAGTLRRAAELLALGAPASSAWAGRGGSQIDALLRLARRSSASGSALAQGVGELAQQARAQADDAAEAASGRASVLIAGPLGLCYLPAFVCLGIVPMIAGLATDVLKAGGL